MPVIDKIFLKQLVLLTVEFANKLGYEEWNEHLKIKKNASFFDLNIKLIDLHSISDP